ncbi:MAG TPA: hypothetical protein VKD69_21725 [Vicinamibacterales bacterium]|nr:hypothetical protein [Vicinamibacterales bacterium]
MMKLSAASVWLAFFLIIAPAGAQSPGRDVGCAEWRQCRQMALSAAERGDYERFHDLAWRAVQLGPPKDTSLLSMLARAQALSGRPHDALVMIDRLAEMGVAVDAETGDEFARTRQLPGWPAVRARIEGLKPPAAAAAATSAAPAPAPATSRGAKAGAVPRAEPPPAAAPATDAAAVSTVSPPAVPSPTAPEEAIRFSTRAFTPAGIAYDAVSGRFLFADRRARKLFVVSERSSRTTDFVRGDSAGFQDIAAMEIDAKRGDLWVASTAPREGAGIVHKLQLVSGRPLRSFPIAADLEPVTLVDLAVTGAGAVLVLDSASTQLLTLRPGAADLERVVRLDVREPASLAVSGDGGMAYVTHHDGVLRIDLRTHATARLTAPSSVPLDRLERIRWRDRSLVAVRVDEDGTRRIVRLDLNASGRSVSRATTLERPAAVTGPIFLTSWGDELVYIADESARTGQSAGADASTPAEFVAYRIKSR